MGPHLPRFAEVQELLDERLTYMTRTKHVAKRMASGDKDWTTERIPARQAMHLIESGHRNVVATLVVLRLYGI